MLTKAGAAWVFEAADGNEATEILRSHAIDWILLDIQMEPMDGLTFLKRLRMGKLQQRRDLPVAILTGIGDQRVLGAALALDCQAFIVKDQSVSRLYEQLLSIEGRRSEVRPAVAYSVIPVPQDLGTLTNSKLTSNPAPGTRRASPEKPTPVETQTFEGKRVKLREIPAGAVLAEDVVSVHGAILLRAGHTVSDSIRQRLLDLGDMLEPQVVRIRPPEAPRASQSDPHMT